MTAVIVVGAQWGDEGKGKIIDLLTHGAQHVVRAQGGNNAGHTIVVGDVEYKLHLVPSGILQRHTTCYIGAGTVLDPEVLLSEIDELERRGVKVRGRLWISAAAHVIFSYHKILDSLLERRKAGDSVGTTGRGIGPCYADKAYRLGIRMETLVDGQALQEALEDVLPHKNTELTKVFGHSALNIDAVIDEYRHYGERLKPFVGPVESDVACAVAADEQLLFEGAQGTFLDSNFGTYPFVTSSNTTAGGLCVGAGVGPGAIDHTIGVVKAYTTRVGNGPFPTEHGANENIIDTVTAREVGTTTGRQRRTGWLDGVLLCEAVRLNGLNSLAVTKLDILDKQETIKLCTHYELDGQRLDRPPTYHGDLVRVVPVYEELPGWQETTSAIQSFDQLPDNAKNYLRRIEALCSCPISIVSVGPERESTIILEDIFAVEGVSL